MSDLLHALAVVYARRGAERLPAQEITNTLSFDLRWLTPSAARRAVGLAVERGFLRHEGDLLVPVFDPHAVEVPVGFRPDPQALEAPPAPPPAPRARTVLEEAAALAGTGERELRAEGEKGKLAGLGPEAAALLALARRGHDVATLAARALDEKRRKG